ncbi:MAG: DUF2782 domain-containing protein [Gammaproteobacteria bacterium]|nr:DUF2782 domain-containing protein [Gammaproteobacteria bacterium]
MIKLTKTLFIFLSSLALAWSLQAGEVNHGGLEPAPEPPELPDPLQSGETIEPEVTIVREQDRVVHEYRLNGRLYMVKVIPSVGKPYYLLDQDGDGRMESRMSDIYNNTIVPQWVLFSW